MNFASCRHTLAGAPAMKICVHSNRGPRGDEIPCAFYLGGRRLPVLALLERWTDSTHGYFEVMVDDGRRFVLRYQPTLRCWQLARALDKAGQAVEQAGRDMQKSSKGDSSKEAK